MKPASRKSLQSALKVAAVLAVANGLSGCIVALPPAVQFASLALDGITFVATGKTVTDHALSAVTERDCAMVRALNGAEICSDDAQLTELEALERRLDSPSAESVTQSVTPVDQDEDFKRARIELAERGDEDEVLDAGATELPDMGVAQGPLF